MIKDKKDGWIYFHEKKYVVVDTYKRNKIYVSNQINKPYNNFSTPKPKENPRLFDKHELIEQISKVACIPYCTIVEIYVYHRTYIDEYKNYTKAFNIENGRYSYKGEQTIYYAYVDLYKDSVFYNINNTQLQSDSNKKNLENQVSDLNRTISNLNSQNWESNRKINDLTTQNKELIKKQENINREMTKKKQ
jgi:hypothetical protein